MQRILLVENNRSYREAIKENLVRQFPSLIIDEAENGDNALKKVRAAPPQLIFMDIRLTGINGLQLTQKIKKEFPDIHIFMLTGYDVPEYRQAAAEYGANGFFVKETLKWDEVRSLVESLEKPALQQEKAG
jgi:two-component system, response regulator YesN